MLSINIYYFIGIDELASSVCFFLINGERRCQARKAAKRILTALRRGGAFLLIQQKKQNCLPMG